MGTKQFRVTITLDDKKEQDLIEALQSLSRKKQLGDLVTDLVRQASDKQAIAASRYTDLTISREKFFSGVARKLKEQDDKINTIYRMCEDLYGLARANKAMGLEDKTRNLMVGQFILQSQQNKIKALLGEGEFNYIYESERLIREKEKADRIWEFIVETYGNMLTELQGMVCRPIEIAASPLPYQQTAGGQGLSGSQGRQDDDEYIDLTEPPKDEGSDLEMTAEKANKLSAWMDML